MNLVMIFLYAIHKDVAISTQSLPMIVPCTLVSRRAHFKARKSSQGFSPFVRPP